jgi:hypothetical protein
MLLPACEAVPTTVQYAQIVKGNSWWCPCDQRGRTLFGTHEICNATQNCSTRFETTASCFPHAAIWDTLMWKVHMRTGSGTRTCWLSSSMSCATLAEITTTCFCRTYSISGLSLSVRLTAIGKGSRCNDEFDICNGNALMSR